MSNLPLLQSLWRIDQHAAMAAAAAAANLQPAAQPQATDFLSLPPKIRLQIYNDVFKGQIIAITWSLPSPAARRILRARGLSLRKRFWRARSHARDSGEEYPAAIMHTSHLLRQEALVLFYRNTHFHLDLGPNPIQGLRAFVNNGLGDPAFAVYIRKISLELNMRTEPYHPWSDRELVVRLGRWVARFPAQGELTLAYPHRLKWYDFVLGGGVQPNVVIRQGAWLDRGIELLVESYLKVRRVVPPGVGAGPVLTVGRRFYWRVSERLVWEAGTFSLELVSWEMVDNR